MNGRIAAKTLATCARWVAVSAAPTREILNAILRADPARKRGGVRRDIGDPAAVGVAQQHHAAGRNRRERRHHGGDPVCGGLTKELFPANTNRPYRSRPPPRTICHLKMGPHPLIDLRRVALRPARHGRVIDGNASIGQHPLKVSIADRKLKVPTHRPKDHVSRKMTASELIFAPIHRSGPAPRSLS